MVTSISILAHYLFMVQRRMESGQHRKTCKDQQERQAQMEMMVRMETMGRMEVMGRQ
jgi:hypothetical protein